jgi:alcohol dehydrogenase class IV
VGFVYDVAASRVTSRSPPPTRDLDARACALYGAWLAGWVLGTPAYNLPHAGTHSAVLPFVTAYNAPAAPAAMVRGRRPR